MAKLPVFLTSDADTEHLQPTSNAVTVKSMATLSNGNLTTTVLSDLAATAQKFESVLAKPARTPSDGSPRVPLFT